MRGVESFADISLPDNSTVYAFQVWVDADEGEGDITIQLLPGSELRDILMGTPRVLVLADQTTTGKGGIVQLSPGSHIILINSDLGGQPRNSGGVLQLYQGKVRDNLYIAGETIGVDTNFTGGITIDTNPAVIFNASLYRIQIFQPPTPTHFITMHSNPALGSTTGQLVGSITCQDGSINGSLACTLAPLTAKVYLENPSYTIPLVAQVSAQKVPGNTLSTGTPQPLTLNAIDLCVGLPYTTLVAPHVFTLYVELETVRLRGYQSVKGGRTVILYCDPSIFIKQC